MDEKEPNPSATDSPAGNEQPPAEIKSKPSSQSMTTVEWMQVLSTFIVFFNTWGMLLTFGAFQTYYEQVLLSDYSSSSISWISTTSSFIVLAAGIITGPLFDYGFYQFLFVGGSLLQVFGLMMMSLSTKYYQLFLAQSICVGLGSGMAFTPSVAAASVLITDPAMRAKLMGLMASGSSIGGIIYPIMFRRLIVQTSFGWTTRAIAFVAFGLYVVSYLVLLYPPKKSQAVRRFFDTSAFTDLPFMTLCVASLFSATAYYIPLLYLPILALSTVSNVDTDLIFYFLAIINGASFFGRVLAGIVAAKLGPTETISAAAFVGSILLFSWIVVDSVAGIIVWAVFWGIISGVLVTLPGAFIPLFSPSLSVIGTRSGMYWSWVGLGILIGSPIGAAIYDPKSVGTDHWRLQVFAGCFMMAAGLFTIYPLIHLHRKRPADSERNA